MDPAGGLSARIEQDRIGIRYYEYLVIGTIPYIRRSSCSWEAKVLVLLKSGVLASQAQLCAEFIHRYGRHCGLRAVRSGSDVGHAGDHHQGQQTQSLSKQGIQMLRDWFRLSKRISGQVVQRDKKKIPHFSQAGDQSKQNEKPTLFYDATKAHVTILFWGRLGDLLPFHLCWRIGWVHHLF